MLIWHIITKAASCIRFTSSEGLLFPELKGFNNSEAHVSLSHPFQVQSARLNKHLGNRNSCALILPTFQHLWRLPFEGIIIETLNKTLPLHKECWEGASPQESLYSESIRPPGPLRVGVKGIRAPTLFTEINRKLRFWWASHILYWLIPNLKLGLALNCCGDLWRIACYN